MNVFLDAQPLLGTRSGIARYVECLYRDLCKLDDQLHITLAFNRIAKGIDRSQLQLDTTTTHLIRNSRYPYKVIRRFMKPNPLYSIPYDWGILHKKADIFHGTNFIYHPIGHGRTVITIHDLAYMKFPESTSDRIYRHHTRWVPYSAQRADHIIADSSQTKQDIVDLLNIAPDKVDVILIAADDHFRPLPEHIYRPLIEKYNLPERYYLFVGTVEPRKNLLGLVQAYHLLKQNHSIAEKLVIVGAKGWKFSPIFEWIQQHGLDNDIIFTGFVEDDDLVAIYNGATLFVMPSIYEGFGIPILEAMQCGIPVIGSNVSSIPEVIGTSGMMVAPDDYEGWAQAMYRLATDESVHRHYAAESLKRAEQFNWRKVATQTKQVYDKVMTV